MKRIFRVLLFAVLLQIPVFADDAASLSSDALLKELNISESLRTDSFMQEVDEFIRTARPVLYRPDERIESFAGKDYKRTPSSPVMEEKVANFIIIITM